ncbi:hypothetical protein [Streptomyces cremeus]
MWRHAPAHRLVDQWLTEHQAAVRLLDISVTFPAVYARDGWDLGAEELAFYDMFIHPVDWARHLLGDIGHVDAVRLAGTRPGEVATSIRLLSPSGDAAATINAATGSHAYQVSAWLHTTTGDLLEVDTKDRLRVTTAPAWSGTEGSLRDRATLGWEAGQLYRGWARKGYAEELAAFADRVESCTASGDPVSDELDGAAHTLEIIGRCLAPTGAA